MKYISISDAVWESSLKAKQREMDSYGLGFRVASTDETIDIRFVVPVNQLHPRFDKNNLNLTGVAVEGTKSKHCRAEKTFMKPLRHCKILEAELAAKASGAQTRHRPTLDEFMLTVNHDALKECVIQQGLLGTVAPIWLDRCADFAMYAEYLGTTKNGAKEKFADAIVNCTSASDLTRRLSR